MPNRYETPPITALRASCNYFVSLCKALQRVTNLRRVSDVDLGILQRAVPDILRDAQNLADAIDGEWALRRAEKQREENDA
jgi:hypothetical protein